jgi:hypothetical protein
MREKIVLQVVNIHISLIALIWSRPSLAVINADHRTTYILLRIPLRTTIELDCGDFYS